MSPRHSALLFLLPVSLFSASPAADDHAVRLDPFNPHYLYWKGRSTVLVASGEHYGSVVNPDFDFHTYLATVQADGLNHTRLFLGDYVEGPGSFGISNNTLAPAAGRFLAPWARSNVPGYALGGNKFDLDRWDPAYFERLRSFVADADRRGIVVEAVLFFAGPGYAFAPLNPRNNVNSTAQLEPTRYLSVENGDVLGRQEQYARKIVRELNPFPNVIFNVCNEPWFSNQEKPGFASQPPASVKEWIGRASGWIADEESHLPSKHLISVDLTNQGSVVRESDRVKYFNRISIFNVHYDANAEALLFNPGLPAALALNETGFNGTKDDYYRTQGWNFLLSGGAIYGNLDFSFSVGHEDGSAIPRFTENYNAGGGAGIRRQMRILLGFMQSLPLGRMQRDGGIIVGGADSWRALASPGEAYAAWFPGAGPIEPLLALPRGRWRAEWVDILTGAVTTEEFVQDHWISAHKGQRVGGGAALRIFRMGDLPSIPGPEANAADPGHSSHETFSVAADEALGAMRARAQELKIGGVAVVARFTGDSIQSWESKMIVVGRMKDPPTPGNNGNNLLGIAYAKATEMADTLKNSGAGTRPPMVGEFGWQGGVIGRLGNDYLIAAFSGGRSEDDVQVSKAGLEVLKRFD